MQNESAVRAAPEFRFNKNRIIWPFIIACMMLAFYTTYHGFSQVLGGGLLANVVAVAMSGLLVVIASFCSYQLGATTAAALLSRRGSEQIGKGAVAVIALAFIFCAFGSGLFSFTFWHENFYRISARGLEGQAQPRDLAALIVPKLNEKAEASLKADAEAILQSPDVAAWQKGFEKLSRLAEDGKNKFADALAAEQKRQEEEFKNRLNEVERLNSEVGAIDRDIAPKRDRLAGIEAELNKPRNEPALDELRKKAAAAKAAREASQNGADDSHRAGCGTICKPLLQEELRLEREVTQLQRELKPQMDERARLRAEIGAKDKERQEKLQRINDLRNQMSGGSDEAKAPRKPISNLADSLRGITDALTAFLARPTRQTLNDAQVICGPVLTAAKPLFSQQDLPNTCELAPGEGTRLIEARDAHAAAVAEWQKTCGQEGEVNKKIDRISADVEAKALDARKALGEASKLIESCIDSSKSAGVNAEDQAAFHRAAANFVLQNSLERNEFERSMAALWAFTPAARSALLLSAFIECAILIFKTLTDIVRATSARPKKETIRLTDTSDNPNEPQTIRARKAVLRIARPDRRHECEISDADIDRMPELAASVRALLNQLGRTQNARTTKTGYHVTNAALFRIEQDLAELATAPSTPNRVDVREEARSEPGTPIAPSAPRDEGTPSSQRQDPALSPTPGARSLRERLANRMVGGGDSLPSGKVDASSREVETRQ
jgi:hypothetical protein